MRKYKQRKMPVVNPGDRFGRLTIINAYYKHDGYQLKTFVDCKCECGNFTTQRYYDVKRGAIVGCGCTSKKHGLTRTRFYRIWADMKTRCHSNDQRFSRYRQVGMCERWMDASNFVMDMYQSYVEHVKIHGVKDTSLDRIDNNKGYSKENCRWATFKQQQQNRSNNRLITYRNRTASVAEFCDELGLNHARVINRLHSGWSVEEALEIPSGIRRKSWELNEDMP